MKQRIEAKATAAQAINRWVAFYHLVANKPKMNIVRCP